MTLGELISALEKADQSRVVPYGFGIPRSYRGYYEDVAFEPAQDVTVASMLVHAKSALGATFEGYKGGEYTMHDYTTVWISAYGCCSWSDGIGPTLLKYMLGDP